MKKNTSFSTKGYSTIVGPLSIQRMLPNRYTNKVGPFVFFDYVSPVIKEAIHKKGMGAHPHRGIATLTYVLQGEVEHFDSAGNTGKIFSGGAQWMKAGNGIIHDESFNRDSLTVNKYIEGFQFWINLPAKNKAEKPDHIAIQAKDIPQKSLPNHSGYIKVIVGNYEDLSSTIPYYSLQFLYHIHLEAGKQFSIVLDEKTEVAAFLLGNTVINEIEFQKRDLVEFNTKAGEIEFRNINDVDIDVLLFGGEAYTEPMVAEGPFVMNTQSEIIDAYRDFYEGKYGKINL